MFAVLVLIIVRAFIQAHVHDEMNFAVYLQFNSVRRNIGICNLINCETEHGVK